MKKVIFTILCVSVQTALAQQNPLLCQQREAQVQAYVKGSHKVRVDHNYYECAYSLQPFSYQVSQTCPLFESEIERVEFSDESCVLKDGDIVSGIIVEKNGFFSLQ